MAVANSALDRARKIAADRHKYAKEWKERTGGRVIGYLCTYVPEEILAAAGILPVRLFGGREPEYISEPHIYSTYCPFSRAVLAEGLLGHYDYVDGIAKARSCNHIRNTYSSWLLHVPSSFHFFVAMPSAVQSRHAKPYLAREYAELKKGLEEWTGAAISDAVLDRTFEVYNTNRRLLHQIYKYRKSDPPRISGAEVMDLVIANQVMDKAENNELLRDVLVELETRDNPVQSGIRLLLVGGENDDVRFVELAESLGANIVIDDTCTGSRYFWNEIVPEEDRLAALAGRYVDRPPCPIKDFPERRRIPYVQELAREYNVQGVILYQQKFCDPHEFDLPALQRVFEGKGLPCLALEFDVTMPTGQFRTRIEAFLETLQLDVI